MAGFMARSKLDPSRVQLMVVGPSVGPHLGPGCVGGVVLAQALTACAAARPPWLPVADRCTGHGARVTDWLRPGDDRAMADPASSWLYSIPRGIASRSGHATPGRASRTRGVVRKTAHLDRGRRPPSRHQRIFRSMTTEHVAAEINAWKVAQQQFDLAADRLNLDPGLRRVLREPRRELTVHFPVQMDDGSVQVFTGYPRPAQPRSRPGQGRHPLPPGRQHRRGQGPRDVDDLEVRGRGHPLRRRQGRRDRRPEEALAQGAGAPLPPVLHRDRGPHRAERDIPAPDVNTNAQIMAWFMDTYSMHVGYTVPGVISRSR